MSFYTQREVYLSTLIREASICSRLYVAVNITDQGEENKKPRNALQVFCGKLRMCFVYRNEDERTDGVVREYAMMAQLRLFSFTSHTTRLHFPAIPRAKSG